MSDPMTVCLFFESTEVNEEGEKKPPQKIVYAPKVDKFESLQVKGLYEEFKDHIEGDLHVTAMANGIASRPAVFKNNLEQAQIMNLII